MRGWEISAFFPYSIRVIAKKLSLHFNVAIYETSSGCMFADKSDVRFGGGGERVVIALTRIYSGHPRGIVIVPSARLDSNVEATSRDRDLISDFN